MGSDGFVILKGRPRGIPGLVEPDKEILAKKYYNQLTGKPMTEYLIASGAPGAPAWLAAAAKYGEIPYVRKEGPNDVPPGDLGVTVDLECDDVKSQIQLMAHVESTAEDFWALPSEVLASAERASMDVSAASVRHQQHPAIGY